MNQESHFNFLSLTARRRKRAAPVRRQFDSLLEGGFVDKNANVLAFGLPGRAKTHCLCAIARELIPRHQTSVWFTPAFKLVQHLLKAKEALRPLRPPHRGHPAPQTTTEPTIKPLRNRNRNHAAQDEEL